MTKPRERSIIWRGWEVRAILAGRKVRTTVPIPDMPAPDQLWWNSRGEPVTFKDDTQKEVVTIRCPFGVPGDRLIGKETWRARKIRRGQRPAILCEYLISPEIGREILFEGDNLPRLPNTASARTWLSPAIMPRWASRLPLVITSVAVGRVGDVGEDDARAHGIFASMEYPFDNGELSCPNCGGQGVHGAFAGDYGVTEVDCLRCDTLAKRFRLDWDSRWPKYLFAENPFVWHIGHEVAT